MGAFLDNVATLDHLRKKLSTRRSRARVSIIPSKQFRRNYILTEFRGNEFSVPRNSVKNSAKLCGMEFRVLRNSVTNCDGIPEKISSEFRWTPYPGPDTQRFPPKKLAKLTKGIHNRNMLIYLFLFITTYIY